MSGGVTMVWSCPVVSHQAATIEAAAQELPTDEFRAATPAPMAVRCRVPGPLRRDRCVARDRRRAGRQQIIQRRRGGPVMRHILAARPIATRPIGMREPPPTAGLIAPPGSTLRAMPGSRGAVSGTVDLPAIATAADQALGAATGTHKQPG